MKFPHFKAVIKRMPEYQEYLDNKRNLKSIHPMITEPVLTHKQQEYCFKWMGLYKTRLTHFEELRNTNYHSYFTRVNYYKQCVKYFRDLLINSNLPLYFKICMKHHSITTKYYNEYLEEIISNNIFALIKAVDYFDYTKENKFSTYLYWATINSLKRETGQRINSNKKEYISTETILNKLVDGNIEITKIYDKIDRNEQWEKLSKRIAALSKRPRWKLRIDIINRMLTGKDSTEISRELGCTKQNVNNIYRWSIRKLKESLSA